jgi:hypothetical protein
MRSAFQSSWLGDVSVSLESAYLGFLIALGRVEGRFRLGGAITGTRRDRMRGGESCAVQPLLVDVHRMNNRVARRRHGEGKTNRGQ